MGILFSKFMQQPVGRCFRLERGFIGIKDKGIKKKNNKQEADSSVKQSRSFKDIREFRIDQGCDDGAGKDDPPF